jgi:hypothetical protein
MIIKHGEDAKLTNKIITHKEKVNFHPTTGYEGSEGK